MQASSLAEGNKLSDLFEQNLLNVDSIAWAKMAMMFNVVPTLRHISNARLSKRRLERGQNGVGGIQRVG